MIRTLVQKFLVLNHRTLSRRLSTKQSYYHCVGNDPLKALTLGQVAELASIKHGEKIAVISCHQNKKLTFQSLLDEADRLAAGFIKLGLQKGDKIGLWAPNLLEWYVTFIASARAGLVTVCMNPYYQTTEVKYVITKVGMKALVCGDVFRKQNYYNIINKICPEILNSKPNKIISQNIPSLRNVIIMSDDCKRGTFKYSDILNLSDQESVNKVKQQQHNIQIDDPCNIQFTSGTTGNPKAPMQSHFSVVNNGYFCGKRTELHKKHHIICLQNPFFHAFGTVVAISSALNHGSTLVLPSDGYDPDKNLTAITREKCSVIFGTPTMYVDLVAVQRKRNEKIYAEIALSGGALCPPKLFKDMLEVLKVKKVKSIYGLTENSAAAFFSTENDTEMQATCTVGKVIEHTEAKVINKEGNIVPFGEPGELCIRGYSKTLGYYEDEEKTKQLIDSSEWLHTGDQFVLNEDGYGSVVGRLKDMINRGGENIYPKEIEEFLITHADILEAYVVGVPHERLGEELAVCIKTKNNNDISQEDIYKFCKGKISSFKIPKIVKTVDSFPTTTSGKVQKFKIIDIILNTKQ